MWGNFWLEITFQGFPEASSTSESYTQYVDDYPFLIRRTGTTKVPTPSSHKAYALNSTFPGSELGSQPYLISSMSLQFTGANNALGLDLFPIDVPFHSIPEHFPWMFPTTELRVNEDKTGSAANPKALTKPNFDCSPSESDPPSLFENFTGGETVPMDTSPTLSSSTATPEFFNPFPETPSPTETKQQHTYIQTTNTAVRNHRSDIVHINSGCGDHYFACIHHGCKHSIGFTTKNDALSHVKMMHNQCKPFLCITCGASFLRRQDAIRHVTTKNDGKRYMCRICRAAYSRKDYCRFHEKRCVFFVASPSQGEFK
ncbi:hypothetical protein K439DRAFT_1640184 [Ramaria rubella]|nr:hypothetical protein K439DRAFT_1640184 [Ramaria rubella]